jgi:hypothetical protein
METIKTNNMDVNMAWIFLFIFGWLYTMALWDNGFCIFWLGYCVTMVLLMLGVWRSR